MASLSLTADERQCLDDLTAAAGALAHRSWQITVRTGEPRATSLMLFRRLWSHHRGYLVLVKAERFLEADIVLRAALEAAICISANYVLQEDFYPLVVGDLVATLKAQIRRFREDGFTDLVRDYEATLREMTPKAPAKPKHFDWKELAIAGGQETLYDFYRMLSAVSSHVTAFSLMRGVITADSTMRQKQDELSDLETGMHPVMMAAALLVGSKLHAEVIGAAEIVPLFGQLEQRLNILTDRRRRA